MQESDVFNSFAFFLIDLPQMYFVLIRLQELLIECYCFYLQIKKCLFTEM